MLKAVLLLDKHIYRGISPPQAEGDAVQELAAHYLRPPAEPNSPQRHIRFQHGIAQKDSCLSAVCGRYFPAEYIRFRLF